MSSCSLRLPAAFLSFTLAWVCSVAAFATLIAPAQNGTIAPGVRGVQIPAYYSGASSCAMLPVRIDMFVWDTGTSTWEFHNACYTNGATPSSAAVFCPFKYPLPPGTPASSILLYAYDAVEVPNSPVCWGYNYSNYVAWHPSGTIPAGDNGLFGYRSYGKTIAVGNANYSARVSRSNGTLYEFYNLRVNDPDLRPNHFENAILSHFGGAMQTALFGNPVMQYSCDPAQPQGFWNPTQAGSNCGWLNGATLPGTDPTPGTADGPNVYCDGTLNNSCSSAFATVTHSPFRMLNWDYGYGTPSYQGPYNSQDGEYLTQTVSVADPDFLQVDLRLFYLGPRLDLVPGINPMGAQLTNRFSEAYFQEAGGTVGHFSCGVRSSINGTGCSYSEGFNNSPPVPGPPEVLWFSMHNTVSAGSYWVTAALLRAGEWNSVYDRAFAFVAQSGGSFDAFSYGWPWYMNAMALPGAGTSFRSRLLLFPYAYNDYLPRFGKTVAEVIADKRAAYAPSLSVAGHLDSIGSNGLASGWAAEVSYPSYTNWVSLYIDQGGGNLVPIGSANAAYSHSDQGYGATHGWSFTIPNQWRDNQPHVLRAYASGVGLNTTSPPPSSQEIAGSGVSFTLCPVVCGGNCVDTQTDPNNCGSCGNVCSPGRTCSSGTCHFNCAICSDCGCNAQQTGCVFGC
jgi:hypothetical protein